MDEIQITLSEILAAREARVALQGDLRSTYRRPMICFTMNMAGPVKVTALSHRAFDRVCAQLRLELSRRRLPLLHAQVRSLSTGDEGYFVADAPAEALKSLCMALEQAEPLGRLLDLDVLTSEGEKLSRGEERPCLVCGLPGRGCASRRVHTVAQLQAATRERLSRGLAQLDRDRLTALCTGALREEVCVTPKPGLVDRDNSGAHRDMDISHFLDSAAALEPYWGRCWDAGRLHRDEAPDATFALLRPLGLEAERAMLAATGGVNTHKGAIFTLGVLCGALGRLWTAEDGFPDAATVCRTCAAMTRKTLERELAAAGGATAGERLYLQSGVRGIRGQMADGLPAVCALGLPTLRGLLKAGVAREHAAAVTLLHLIAATEDTNLLHRGGSEGAAWARAEAAALLKENSVPAREALQALDREFIRRGLSPGGCADLLAATLLLERLAQEDSSEAW